MKKIRKNILLKTLLILLHIGFYVGNTAFIHTHRYFNYSVTHSHPFAKTPEGAPDHTHDKAALDTIAQFNSLSFDFVLFFFLGIVSVLIFTFIQQRCPSIVLRVVDSYNLRAPPVF